MRTKRIKSLWITALIFVASVAFAVMSLPIFSDFGAQADIIEINNVIESRVALNTDVEVPETATVEYKGAQVQAKDGVVVSPDGKTVKAGVIRLNQTGVYQLKYFFEDSGLMHTAVQNVEVYSDYYNLSNAEGGEIIVSDENNQLYCGKDGLIVNLKSGTSFVYNKVLDLRDVGEDGLSPIIELDTRYGTYDNNGTPNDVSDDIYTPDALEGWVRLTDCYNPNIYMELRMQKSLNYQGALFPGVKTNTQPIVGMDKGDHPNLASCNKQIELDGEKYRVWYGDGSMNVGMYNAGTALTTGTVWKYDMETKRVYLSYNDKENFLVSDLDESLIYSDGNYFSGFTTGEVFVTIYANGYESTYARTEIVSIGKDNLKAVANQEYSDTVAPTVTVNQTKTTQTGVYGAVGDEFKIPTASAVDVNIVEGIDVAVYRGYGTDMQTNVSVVNGKFQLAKKDLYTVVYTAKDKAGNEGKAIFTVSTLETQDNRAVTLLPKEIQTVSAGERIASLYEITDSLNLDKSKVKVKISVESENQNLVGEGANFSFTPYYEGEYVVRYQYTDGIFEYEKTVTFQSERSSIVCFIDEANLPRYFLKNAFYAIDDIKAYTFVKGYPEAVDTEIYAVFNGGAKQKIESPSKVQMTGANNVYFLYEADGAEALQTKTVGILDTAYSSGLQSGSYDMTKFFVGDFTANVGSSFLSRDKDIVFTSKKTSGNNTLTYFKEISARDFKLKYKIVAQEEATETAQAKGNLDGIRITLTDVANPDNKLVAEIRTHAEKGCYLSINGGALTRLETINFIDEKFVEILYKYDDRNFQISNHKTSVDFNASLAYLDIEMLDISGEASVIVSQINYQSIAGDVFEDKVKPQIYVPDFQGEYEVGEVVRITLPEFSDVITGIDYASATLTVRAQDGNPVYDPNGNELTNLKVGEEYEIMLDRITTYFVKYTVCDFGSGKSEEALIKVSCVDTVAPTITLNNLKDGQTLRVKAYAEIKINYTLSDNISKPANIKTYVHLYCLDMYSFVPNVSNIEEFAMDGVYQEKFTIKIRGKYQAQIHAIDEKGNLAVKYIEIIVE